MNQEIFGLLIDSTGIQKYIFSSNKLKLNLGASYIIEHELMVSLLLAALNKVGKKNHESLDSWKLRRQISSLENNEIKLGYAGGGRCLLFCGNKGIAKNCADQYSLLVMQYFPGIILSATILRYDEEELRKIKRDSDKTVFQTFMRTINKELGRARSENHIITAPLSPGYVKKDGLSEGYTDPDHTQFLKDKGLDTKPIAASANKNGSLTTLTKLKYADRANNQHTEDFLNKKGQDYSFPTEFEGVCMEENEGFLAVVHVDGNGIGRKFQGIESLEGYKNLSDQVKEIGKRTIQYTVKDLISLLNKEDVKAKGKVLNLIQKNRSNSDLPFRPIISGGDDITFVTDGHLGLYLAEQCIKNFTKVTKEKLGQEFHACAGVAIVKRKYPFARAYSLAEELIETAKKESRSPKNSEEKYSYIAMYISKFGISGSLDYIRSQTHERKSAEDTYRMDYGPYLIHSENRDDRSRPEFKDLTRKMRETLSPASSSKVQQLRSALYGTEKNRKSYLERLELIDKDFRKQLGDSLFVEQENNKTTPWIDAIDFMDFYPWELKDSE